MKEAKLRKNLASEQASLAEDQAALAQASSEVSGAIATIQRAHELAKAKYEKYTKLYGGERDAHDATGQNLQAQIETERRENLTAIEKLQREMLSAESTAKAEIAALKTEVSGLKAKLKKIEVTLA